MSENTNQKLQQETKIKPKKLELSANTKIVNGYGKVRKATEVTISFDGKSVASKTLGGEYNSG